MNKLLLPHQNAFIQAPFCFPKIRFFFLICGYGAGKSSCLASMTEYLFKTLQGLKDKEGRGARVLMGGRNIGHLIKTTIRYVLTDLTNAHIDFSWNAKDNELTVGTVTLILASLTDPHAIVGYDVCVSMLDELGDLGVSNADEVAFEAMKAVNERTRQKVKGFRNPFLATCSTTQGTAGGIYRIYTNFKKAGTGFILLRGRTEDNFYLSRDYIVGLKKMYNEKEYRVLMNGEFLSITSGRVFPSFDWDVNFAQIPLDTRLYADETVYYATDVNTGFNRGTAFVVRSGVVFGVKSYDFPDLRTIPQVLRFDFPTQRIFFIPDASNTKDILSFQKELRKYNIIWITRSKNPPVEDTVFAVDKLLYLGRLVFTEAARDTAEAVAGFLRDANNKIPPGKTQSDLAHFVDSCRYAITFILTTNPSMIDVLRITVQRRYEQLKDEEEVKSITDLPGGFVQVNPGALAKV